MTTGRVPLIGDDAGTAVRPCGGSDSSGTLIVGKPGVFGAARRPSTPYAATKLPRVAPMTVAESPATIATADNANYMYLNRPQTTDNALPNST